MSSVSVWTGDGCFIPGEKRTRRPSIQPGGLLLHRTELSVDRRLMVFGEVHAGGDLLWLAVEFRMRGMTLVQLDCLGLARAAAVALLINDPNRRQMR